MKTYVKEQKFNIFITNQSKEFIGEEILNNYIETILTKYKTGKKNY